MLRRHILLASAAAVGGPAFLRAAWAASSGVSDREILLGQSAVLSGPLAPSLNGFNAGAKAAFDASNRRGGVNGRSVRVMSLDDELKPDRAVANYRALLGEHKVFAFFGGVGTGPIAAAIPILRESDAPMVGNYAVGDSTRDRARDVCYFVRASYAREAESLVDLLDTVGMTRIAVAHLANPGGQEVLGLARAALGARAAGRDVVAAGAIGNDGSGVAETAKLVAAGQPQAVIMFLSGPPVAELMKTVWSHGSAPSFYGMSPVAGEVVARALGQQLRGLSIAQVVPYPWSRSDPAAAEYRADCEAAGAPVNYYTYEGWLNAQVMLEGLRRAGRSLTRESLHTAMRGMRTRVASIDVDFTRGPTGSRLVDLVHVRADGSFIR